MKYTTLYILLTFITSTGFAQTVVHDREHFKQVLENMTVRYTAEATHQNHLNKVNENLKRIDVNAGVVMGVQQLIYRSLTEINESLKDGLMVKNMAKYVDDIVKYSGRLVQEAQDEPYLLLFAEENMQYTRDRIINLVTDVNDFILKEGSDAMMDYSKRDWLLDKVNTELLLLRASVWRSLRLMHYAKRNGVLRELNPYKDFINKDLSIVNETIRNLKYLKK